ncbi:MAG: phosphatase PAP2 family protein [Sedimentisphaerales bacterium]|nr:phosphatase PAP2 family protein [Sedimentisphaerales bacterium]
MNGKPRIRTRILSALLIAAALLFLTGCGSGPARPLGDGRSRPDGLSSSLALDRRLGEMPTGPAAERTAEQAASRADSVRQRNRRILLGADNLGRVIKDDLKQLPGNLWQDSKDYIVSRENIAILLLSGAASGYVRAAHDDEIEDHFDGHHTFGRDFTIALGAIPLTELSLTGTGYLLGVLSEDQHLYQVARSMIEAQALNGAYTMALKLIAQDDSPNGEYYAWPSGHTSISMTFAAVMDEFYGPLVGLPLYGLSGLVMYERMETGEHWASDVIFGAAIGYTVGKTVAGKHKPQIFGLDIGPYVEPLSESTGIGLSKRF